ncbi:MAG: hypothetical protein PHP42_08785, partial [Bacteroidota bacterium]|nr:hypothetical protein [Bacteroidota bacterium]
MKKSLLLISLFCLLPLLVSAQPYGPKGQRPMEKLESYKKVRMLETMKLDEETGLKLVSRYNKHREVMKGFE